MPGIRAEIAKLRSGDWPAADDPLGSAPHTLADVTGEWQRPWSLEQAPTSERPRQAHGYWPGERNLFCACVALDA